MTIKKDIPGKKKTVLKKRKTDETITKPLAGLQTDMFPMRDNGSSTSSLNTFTKLKKKKKNTGVLLGNSKMKQAPGFKHSIRSYELLTYHDSSEKN